MVRTCYVFSTLFSARSFESLKGTNQYYTVFITGLISIPVFLLGVEMLYRGAKFSSPYLIALASVFPELILTLQASLRSNYYVALSGVLSSIASLYVIGVVMFGTIYFLRWKKDMVVGRINDYNFVIVSSVCSHTNGNNRKIELVLGSCIHNPLPILLHI